MLKIINLILTITILAIGLSAQTVSNTVPVKWQEYKISDHKISVLFPKLPVYFNETGSCEEFTTQNFAAYAESAAYKIKIVAKDKNANLKKCESVTKFDKSLFEDEIETALANNKDSVRSKAELNGNKVVKISKYKGAIWFVNDLKNNKWVEMETTSNASSSEIEEMFFKSLKIGGNFQGIEIGEGAPTTLGDEKSAEKAFEKLSVDQKEVPKEKSTTPLTIALKPRANYTDAARQNNIQGTVSLRVTFSSNGSIGNVAVVSALPFGLTEQAITAVRKLVFLPQQNNGENVTVIKTVQYAFSIY